jgi:hypothetical protein
MAIGQKNTHTQIDFEYLSILYLKMSVCPTIDSAPGSARVLRPVSLEPVGLRVCNVKKIFPEK